MEKQKFLGNILNENQKVLSLMGPSGTGKSYSADFVQKYFGYKIAKQITTRESRPDDKHYTYMSKEEFIQLEQEGKILGLFAGDRATLQGNGYGYLKKDLNNQLNVDKKIILFPSAYELLQPNFEENYGTTDKIGLGFKDSQSVLHRALQCNKKFSESELMSRIETATTLTRIMEEYAKKGDKTFTLIYSDAGSQDLYENKTIQLQKIATSIGYNIKSLKNNLDDYICR